MIVQNFELVKKISDFRFKGSIVEIWRKGHEIPVGNGIWVSMQFALHEHDLLATWSKYNSMIESKATPNDAKTHPFVRPAITIVGPDITIILVDR